MQNKELIKFIKESRNKGFSDLEIRKPLLKKGWPAKIIESAFSYLNAKSHSRLKSEIGIFLNPELTKILEKRAKKHMLSISEQIEDIIRRSCASELNKKKSADDKIDDILVKCFSKSNRGRKKKK
jgi:hypothetical protein